MLLLVLILVLVAFGLLVVALLTGNVLCAWLSVAVSVAAAVVLVVDWLQRRSALKAGAAAGAQPASMPLEPRPVADLDPVTEVLPVVPNSSDIDGEDVGGADFGEGDTSGGRASEADTRYEPRPDGQQTVILSAIQPSGSTARPSGAEGPTTSSGGPSSQSVTEARADATAGSAAEARPSDAESTVSVDIRKGSENSAAGSSPASREDHDADATVVQQAEPSSHTDGSTIGSAAAGGAAAAGLAAAAASGRGDTGSSADRSADDTVNSSVADGVGRDHASTNGSASASTAEAAAPSLDKRTPNLEKRAAPDPFSDWPVEDSRPSEAAGFADVKSSDPQDQSGSASSADALVASSEPAAEERASSERASSERTSTEKAADATAPAGGSGEQSARSTFGGPVSSGHELFDPVDHSAAASTPPPPPADSAEATAVMSPAGGSSQAFDFDDDPPEEPLDQSAAGIVAGLDDEVLVIDEQPRYHVDTCRAVTMQPSIPLPAREAVELGFTPCGWCTPDAVLSERHQASARP
ncbi:MAG: hypothetical protein QOH17_4459 [Pseudonocardiales bacterium]|nr:hypothetical protein [Pseudonocardiales bacterium]